MEDPAMDDQATEQVNQAELDAEMEMNQDADFWPSFTAVKAGDCHQNYIIWLFIVQPKFGSAILNIKFVL